MKKVENLDKKLSCFELLNERQKRLYVAIESEALGYGGISIVHRSFAVSRNTIYQGLEDLKSDTKLAPDRVRKAGGGRIKKKSKFPNYQK